MVIIGSNTTSEHEGSFVQFYGTMDSQHAAADEYIPELRVKLEEQARWDAAEAEMAGLLDLYDGLDPGWDGVHATAGLDLASLLVLMSLLIVVGGSLWCCVNSILRIAMRRAPA
jgi:hypothetical protein